MPPWSGCRRFIRPWWAARIASSLAPSAKPSTSSASRRDIRPDRSPASPVPCPSWGGTSRQSGSRRSRYASSRAPRLDHRGGRHRARQSPQQPPVRRGGGHGVGRKERRRRAFHWRGSDASAPWRSQPPCLATGRWWTWETEMQHGRMPGASCAAATASGTGPTGPSAGERARPRRAPPPHPSGPLGRGSAGPRWQCGWRTAEKRPVPAHRAGATASPYSI